MTQILFFILPAKCSFQNQLCDKFKVFYFLHNKLTDLPSNCHKGYKTVSSGDLKSRITLLFIPLEQKDHPQTKTNPNIYTLSSKSVVKGLTNLGNTCFFNSVMQVIQYVEAHDELLNYNPPYWILCHLQVRRFSFWQFVFPIKILHLCTKIAYFRKECIKISKTPNFGCDML